MVFYGQNWSETPKNNKKLTYKDFIFDISFQTPLLDNLLLAGNDMKGKTYKKF